MGCASSKATQGAVASVPPKSKAANSHPPPNPNVAVATAANIVTATSSVDQVAASHELFKDEEAKGSMNAVPRTTFQKPQDPAQEARDDAEGSMSMEQRMETHENDIQPTEDDIALASRPESVAVIMTEESALDAHGEHGLGRIAHGSQDPSTETITPLKTKIADEEELVSSHMVELSNESDGDGREDDSTSTSLSGESPDRCTGLKSLDDRHGNAALELPPSDAGTMNGTLQVVSTGCVQELRSPGLVETRVEIETSVPPAIVEDGVVGSDENVGEGECVVNEHDTTSKEESPTGCGEAMARAAVETARSSAAESLPCSDPAPDDFDNEQGSVRTGPLISDFIKATESRVTREAEHIDAGVVLSGDHIVLAERDMDNVRGPERDTLTSLVTPEECQVEAAQRNLVEDGMVDETDTAEISETMPTPLDIQTAEVRAAVDNETVQESSAGIDEDKPSKHPESAVVAPPTMSVTESIDRILNGTDDDSEPITELRNVTSMTRVLISDEKRNSKPSVVDRWGLSTTITKIKTKALSNLSGTDETTAVAAPPTPSDTTSKSDKASVSAKPTTSKATGWSSPKSVERVLLSLSEELAPPSSPSSSTSGLKSSSSSPPVAGKTKVARSTSGRGSDRSSTKATSAASAAVPVSRELTDIERARLFAASVLAETERRVVAGPPPTGPSTTTTTASSWWKQKVSSLQHELQ